MNPVGAILTLLLSSIVFAAPRRYALLGVIGAMCYITQGQVFDVGGFHFTTIRLVLLAGISRCMARDEFKGVEFNSIDKCLVAYLISSILIAAIRAGGDMSALVYQIGCSYNIVFPYLLFRALLKNLHEIEVFLADLAIVVVPFALFMIQESLNGRNFFSFFGGVNSSDEFRDGHFRCSAAFRSPITAGTFGATLMPFFIGLYLTGRRRTQALIGFLAATIIVICSRSSGPLIAYVSGVVGLLFWKWRERMRTVRWGILLSLVSLHVVMKAPVWFLIARVSDVTGGGGWHRAELIDQALNHFGSWWLMGTSDTEEWMPTQLEFGGADLTNQFVTTGVRGGLLSLIVLIAIFVRSFRYLGLAMRQVRGISFDVEIMLWAIGASLYAALVNFLSVSYFDQIEVVWWLLVAVISNACFNIFQKGAKVDCLASSDAPTRTRDGLSETVSKLEHVFCS